VRIGFGLRFLEKLMYWKHLLSIGAAQKPEAVFHPGIGDEEKMAEMGLRVQ